MIGKLIVSALIYPAVVAKKLVMAPLEAVVDIDNAWKESDKKSENSKDKKED